MSFDVVGIGNAIVDVVSSESEAFLQEFGLVKGSMQLIDQPRSQALLGAISSANERPGGSCANTVAGIAAFGGTSAFLGKVADDRLGRVFRNSTRADGVVFDVKDETTGAITGSSVIIVTPDGQRTMNTHLGAAQVLYPEDIDVEMVRSAKILFCEGYIWDIDITKQAIRKAIAAAKDADTKVCVTLSDSFCVHRHFDEWQQLVDEDIDILIGNEAELAALTGKEDPEEAIKAAASRVELLVATLGPKGSRIISGDAEIVVEAHPVEKVVDTTGAGDQFAAGFLYGLTNSMSLSQAGELGSRAASEVIVHMGARPNRPQKELLAELSH